MSQDRSMSGNEMTHPRCWNALPWYVNGTLAASDVEAVERHVGQCAECANELQLQRALQTHLRDGDAVLMAPQSSWPKMAARLDGEDELLMQRNRSRSRMLRAAVAAQAIIIAGMAAVIAWQASGPNINAAPEYRTLTADGSAQWSAAQSTAAQGNVRVVFNRDIALADVNGLLHDLQLQIVSGPTEANVYVLASAKAGDAKTSSQQLLMRLRNDARVVFAEPSQQPAQP